MTITMYDSIDPMQIPLDAQAVAGYINGSWPTFSQLAARFPKAILLSITVTGDTAAHAMAVDDEPGDVSTAGAVAWLRAAAARGTWRPCAYASASAMGGLMAAMQAAGLNLSDFRLWSAHYTGTAHICGPHSCGLVSRDMDGTQWTDRALGRNLDESLLADDFFPWYTRVMTDIPTVKTGSTGQAVKNWQALLVARGYKLVIDGAAGSQTAAATHDFQSKHGLLPDGTAGPDTWTAALTAAA